MFCLFLCDSHYRVHHPKPQIWGEVKTNHAHLYWDLRSLCAGYPFRPASECVSVKNLTPLPTNKLTFDRNQFE